MNSFWRVIGTARNAWARMDQALASGGTRGGQALILFALLLPVLIGIAGLALDVGNMYYQRRLLQGLADAAAITGAQVTNYSHEDPKILPGGVTQATANAQANGVALAELTVSSPPTSGPYAGQNAYIEVVITRTYDNWFMPLFGRNTSTVQARAVARCYIPAIGDAAIVALNESDPDAIRFDGGGASDVQVVGDLLSYGGIDSNGNASSFNIDGSAFAMNGPAWTNGTLTGESYGENSGVSMVGEGDPITGGIASGVLRWPAFPSASASCGNWTIRDNQTPPTVSTGCGGNPNVGNNETGTFRAGRYDSIRVQGDATIEANVTITGTFRNDGDTTFEPGAYRIGAMNLTANSTTQGNGVIFWVTSSASDAVDAAGGAQFDFRAWKPYTPATAPAGTTCVGNPCNTWKNIVFRVDTGGIDFGGNGNRYLEGSLYAPAGEVDLHGASNATLVNGQVIARNVVLSGNGPVVSYTDNSDAGTFGPVLVNTPDLEG